MSCGAARRSPTPTMITSTFCCAGRRWRWRHRRPGCCRPRSASEAVLLGQPGRADHGLVVGAVIGRAGGGDAEHDLTVAVGVEARAMLGVPVLRRWASVSPELRSRAGAAVVRRRPRVRTGRIPAHRCRRRRRAAPRSQGGGQAGRVLGHVISPYLRVVGLMVRPLVVTVHQPRNHCHRPSSAADRAFAGRYPSTCSTENSRLLPSGSVTTQM